MYIAGFAVCDTLSIVDKEPCFSYLLLNKATTLKIDVSHTIIIMVILRPMTDHGGVFGRGGGHLPQRARDCREPLRRYPLRGSVEERRLGARGVEGGRGGGGGVAASSHRMHVLLQWGKRERSSRTSRVSIVSQRRCVGSEFL